MRTTLFIFAISCLGQTIDAGGPGDTFCGGTVWKPGVAGYEDLGAAPWDTLVYAPAFSCSIPTTNGLYEIELGLMEPTQSAIGGRVFTVSVGGSASQPIDLFKLVGLRKPYTLKLTTFVNNGVLKLDFRATVRNAVVSTIKIQQYGITPQGPKGDKGDPGPPGPQGPPGPAGGPIAAHPEADSVLILVNDITAPMEGTEGKTPGLWVAEHYAAARGIPAANIVHVNVPTEPSAYCWDCWHISWTLYDTYIRKPLLAALATRPGIRYIVPTFGFPSHLNNTPSTAEAGWSIDYMLAGIQWAPLTGGSPEALTINWYNDATVHFKDWKNPSQGTQYIVTRLDGPTPQIAAALVDKAIRAESSLTKESGIGYIDFRGIACCDSYWGVDQGVKKTNDLLRTAGFATVFNDQTVTGHMIDSAPNTIFAYGWYSGPNVHDVYSFVDGAVGAQFTSYTANSIRTTILPGTWVPAWLNRGITATWGATWEPGTAGYARGEKLIGRMLDGFSFGEAAYMAAPAYGQYMVFVGDPLYQPRIFRK